MQPSPFFPFLLLLVLSLHCSPASSLDLQCPPGYSIRSNGSSSPYFSNSPWCCPAGTPNFMGASWYNHDQPPVIPPNPPEYNYSDSNGYVYPQLPTCIGCVNSIANSYSQLCSTVNSSSVEYFCCPADYTCSSSGRNCSKSSALIGSQTVAVEVALPLVDMDLCRFHNTSTGIMVPGSPCPSRFTCEAYSLTQYRCYACADPRVGPPGKCDVFTCPTGQFCPAGQSVDVMNATATLMITNQTCPAGSYCRPNAMAPVACNPSMYCPFDGMTQPLVCPAGSYCKTGLNATKCQPSFICPRNGLIEPIACVAPQYCPYVNMTRARDCPQGMYCSDSLIARSCTAGHYCETNFVEPIPCPSGTFIPSDALASSLSSCQPCGSSWLTSNKGSTDCHILSSKTIGLICFGIVVFVSLVIVAVSVGRWCLQQRKERAAAAEAQRLQQKSEAKEVAQRNEQRLTQAIAMVESQEAMQSPLFLGGSSQQPQVVTEHSPSDTDSQLEAAVIPIATTLPEATVASPSSTSPTRVVQLHIADDHVATNN